jgi:hypothetical protein
VTQAGDIGSRVPRGTCWRRAGRGAGSVPLQDLDDMCTLTDSRGRTTRSGAGQGPFRCVLARSLQSSSSAAMASASCWLPSEWRVAISPPPGLKGISPLRGTVQGQPSMPSGAASDDGRDGSRDGNEGVRRRICATVRFSPRFRKATGAAGRSGGSPRGIQRSRCAAERPCPPGRRAGGTGAHHRRRRCLRHRPCPSPCRP